MSLEDIFRAELIVLAGQNPGTNHPRMLSALETAKRRGAKIISINPAEDADPSAVLLAVAGEIENIGLPRIWQNSGAGTPARPLGYGASFGTGLLNEGMWNENDASALRDSWPGPGSGGQRRWSPRHGAC